MLVAHGRRVLDPCHAQRRRPGVTTVVGAAIVRVVDKRPCVLAAQRATREALAGRWEFPGGKVEVGESDVDALVRECREELGVEVAVGAQLGRDLAIPAGRVLRVFACRLVEGEPAAYEHSALRWLGAHEVDDVPWLETNAALLVPLAALLRISS
jgi:8-oxo-dGTP diphosphatase